MILCEPLELISFLRNATFLVTFFLTCWKILFQTLIALVQSVVWANCHAALFSVYCINFTESIRSVALRMFHNLGAVLLPNTLLAHLVFTHEFVVLIIFNFAFIIPEPFWHCMYMIIGGPNVLRWEGGILTHEVSRSYLTISCWKNLHMKFFLPTFHMTAIFFLVSLLLVKVNQTQHLDTCDFELLLYLCIL